MTLKLDMSKGYRRIECDFRKLSLAKFGFDSGWCSRVIDRVCSVSFSILINGLPSKEFYPDRGIWQNDPPPPYLFILCAEVFSHLLQRVEENNSLRGIKVALITPYVNNLLFTDDCVIFSRAIVHGA